MDYMDYHDNDIPGGSMTWHAHLKIPTRLKRLTLWIHPEGKIDASLFLNLQGKHGVEEDEILDTLNQRIPFLVLKREDFHDVCFYNKAFIIRVGYHEEIRPQPIGNTSLPCRLHLSDGSVVDGAVKEALRPESSRLVDYLNLADEPFARIHLATGNVCLVNKAYIFSVTPLNDHDSTNPAGCSIRCETLTNLL
jgi:hypothetical protein